jgi:murein DD-endopeptidase MepM/ murein hydrolase activator NlpD
MRQVNKRALVSILVTSALVALMIFVAGAPAGAQLPPDPIPTLSPPPAPPPPGSSPSPSPSPQPPPPSQNPNQPPPTQTNPNQPPSGAPGPSPVASPAPGSVPGLVVPNLVRTPSRTTARLLEIVSPLTNLGVPVDHAMIRASPPFPVAGFSWFSDDWMFPRYFPTPHLHEGNDIFADPGTPVLASGPGVLAAINTTPVGGNVAWVVGDNGDTYYYAHLIGYPEGLQAGQRIDAGTVIGYVGNTGDAIFSAPHLHFEVHPAIKDRKGRIIQSGVTIEASGIAHSTTPPTNPKPYLDRWLAEAEARANAFVLDLVRRLSGLTRQIYFSQRVDDIFQVETAERPQELMWFSALDPALASMGLARQAAYSSVIPRTRTEVERSAEEQQLAAIRLAVQSPTLELATLTGGFRFSGGS